jgi:hypothetical protein
MEIVPATVIGQKEYPAISLLMSTHPAYPKFKLDRNKMQELIEDAGRQISARFSSHLSNQMIDKLYATVNEINYSHLSNGLAVYVSPHHARVIHLPFEVMEKVVVDQSFEVRDLIYSAKMNVEYLLAMITKNGVRTLFGFGNVFVPVKYKDMPVGIYDVTNSHSLPGWDYLDTEAFDEKNIRNFLRFTDDVLEKAVKETGLNTIVIGDRKLLGYFKAETSLKDKILGYIEGNYEHSSGAEIRKLVEPLLQKHRRAEEEKALLTLAGAVNTGHYESGAAAVWQAVEESRGRLLLVEKDYRQPAKYSDSGLELLPENEMLPSHNFISDVVDDIIEKVMLRGGDIQFVSNGALSQHQRLALVTYY